MALRTERHSARMSKTKNGGLDQYGAGPFERQQFGTAGVEGVKLGCNSNANLNQTQTVTLILTLAKSRRVFWEWQRHKLRATWMHNKSGIGW